MKKHSLQYSPADNRHDMRIMCPQHRVQAHHNQRDPRGLGGSGNQKSTSPVWPRSSRSTRYYQDHPGTDRDLFNRSSPVNLLTSQQTVSSLVPEPWFRGQSGEDGLENQPGSHRRNPTASIWFKVVLISSKTVMAFRNHRLMFIYLITITH